MIMFFLPPSQTDSATFTPTQGGDGRRSVCYIERPHRARLKRKVYEYPPEVAAQSSIGPSPDKVTVLVLPPDARPYRRTDTFTETTVPAALLKAHRTKQGTWALIHVLEGRLAYKIV